MLNLSHKNINNCNIINYNNKIITKISFLTETLYT